MAEYYSVILLILIECLIFYKTDKTRKIYKHFLILTMFLIGCIVGLRSFTVGHDTYNYAHIFRSVIRLDFDSLFTTAPWNVLEKGYLLLMWVFGRICPYPSVFFLVIAIAEFQIVSRWLSQNTKKPFIGVLIFFCMFLTFFLTGLRQNIAMVILLLSYRFLKEDKYIKFVLVVLLASLFHTSALVFLLALAAHKLKPKYYITICAVAFPVMYLFRNSVFLRLTNLYYRYNRFDIINNGEPITYIIMILLVVFGTLALIEFGVMNFEDELLRNNTFNNLNIIATSFLFLPLVGVNGSVLRIVMYFSMYICILVDDIFSNIRDYRWRVFVKTLIITMVVILFITSVSGSSIYRYEFIGWDNILIP